MICKLPCECWTLSGHERSKVSWCQNVIGCRCWCCQLPSWRHGLSCESGCRCSAKIRRVHHRVTAAAARWRYSPEDTCPCRPQRCTWSAGDHDRGIWRRWSWRRASWCPIGYWSVPEHWEEWKRPQRIRPHPEDPAVIRATRHAPRNWSGGCPGRL